MGLVDIYWRIRRLAGRGRVVVQDDTGPVQIVQLQPNDLETLDKIPRLAEFGFQSVPPDGADGIAVFFSGDRSSGVVIATGHQKYRVTGLSKGEACVSDAFGQKVYLSKNGITITDKAGSTVVMNGDGTGTINFPDGLTVNANTKINGTFTTTGNITAPDVIINEVGSSKVHTHLYTPGTSTPIQSAGPTG
jgi:phage baseplate assembly protein V